LHHGMDKTFVRCAHNLDRKAAGVLDQRVFAQVTGGGRCG